MKYIGFDKGDSNIGGAYRTLKTPDGGYTSAKTFTKTEIDFQKLNNLDVESVLRDIGGTFDQSSSRWSMPGESHSGSPKIELRGDGWVHYKTRNGGGPIELIRFWQRGDYNTKQSFDSSDYIHAAEYLAEKHDAYISYEDVHENAKKMASKQASFFAQYE